MIERFNLKLFVNSPFIGMGLKPAVDECGKRNNLVVILFMNENMHLGFVGLCWYNLEKEKKEKRKNEIIAQNLTMGASIDIRFLKKKTRKRFIHALL